jgi:hypothetical protein
MPKPRRKAQPVAVSHARCLSLICLDTELLRAKEEKLHEKSSAKFHEETLLLQAFEEIEKPTFTRWIEAEFSELILACRQHVGEIARLNEFIEDVEDYAFYYGISKREACRQVREKQALGAPLFDDDDDDDDDIHDGEGLGANSDEFEGDDPFAEFARFFEEAFGFKAPPNREQKAKEQPPSASPSRSVIESVKKIYRSLAQLLHPDRATEERPHEPELWHKVPVGLRPGRSLWAREDLAVLECRRNCAFPKPPHLTLGLETDAAPNGGTASTNSPPNLTGQGRHRLGF